jgi:Ca2+-binding RTX toxin-like protein
MRKLVLFLAAMALALVVTSGVASAVNKIGTNDTDLFAGTDGDDNLVGRGGNDFVEGLKGIDNLAGGKGNNFLGDDVFRESSEDYLSDGDGNDTIFVDNGTAAEDVVVCGDGFDRVFADRADLIAADCERVQIV